MHLKKSPFYLKKILLRSIKNSFNSIEIYKLKISVYLRLKKRKTAYRAISSHSMGGRARLKNIKFTSLYAN